MKEEILKSLKNYVQDMLTDDIVLRSLNDIEYQIKDQYMGSSLFYDEDNDIEVSSISYIKVKEIHSEKEMVKSYELIIKETYYNKEIKIQFDIAIVNFKILSF